MREGVRITSLKIAMLSVLAVFWYHQASAQGRPVTIHMTNVTLSEILAKIEKDSGYSFCFNNADFDVQSKKSVNADNASALEVARLVFPNADIRLDGMKIVVKLPPVASKEKEQVVRHNISGTVCDASGHSLPGAFAVFEYNGRPYGAMVDEGGAFSISLPGKPSPDGVLKCSLIGYKDFEIKVGSQDRFDIVLEDDAMLLSETVVVGYGIQKKVNLTGSVSSVKEEDVSRRPIMRATTALQGLASGVTVTQSTGQPGSDGATIRIRGIGTLNDSNPLVLVDGVSGNLDGVNPNDIESISVLKDAASSAIYGSRAANGVILVTTKQGSGDKVSVSYTGYVGFQRPTALPDFVSNYDYMTSMNRAYTNQGMSPLYSESYLSDWLRYRKVDPDHYPDNNWQDALMTGSGFTQNHHISVRGGSKKLSAFGSFAYQSQDGTMPGFGADRFSGRANISMNINKFFTASLLVDARRSTSYSPSYQNNMKSAINRLAGIYTILLTDGRYGTGYNQSNAYALGKEGGRTTSISDALRATFALTWKPFDGFSVDLKYTPSISNTYKKVMKKSVALYDPDITTPVANVPAKSSLKQTDSKTTLNTIQALINYNHDFTSGSSIGVLGGYEMITNSASSTGLSREGFTLPEYEVVDAGSTELMQNEGTASAWALMSFFARAQYSYKSRYLLEANVRADGSSRFAPGHKWGVFPSFSAGWRLSEEKFLKNVDWLSNLKLRLSWGALGNQEIGTYPAYEIIAFAPAYVFGGASADGGKQAAFANSKISWETSTTSDVGVDWSFFKNRLSGSFDFYVKNTSDILLKLPIATITGLTAPYQNAGKVRNTGWDFDITWKDRAGEFDYSLTFNLSDVINKVIDLKGMDPIKESYTIISEGHPINALYGYVAQGLFRDRNDLINHASQSYFGDYSLGDIKYADISSEDGTENVINAYDRTIIGNQIPRFTFGINFSAEWRGLDFSLLIQGVGKRDILLNGDCVWALYNGGKMQSWMQDNWTPDNVGASYPRLIAASTHNNFQNSSFWVYNAAFARLKTAQIGYTIPIRLTEKVHISKIRFYLSGDNLFTISGLPKGWDPEMESGGAEIYPLNRTYLAGLQVTF